MSHLPAQAQEDTQAGTITLLLWNKNLLFASHSDWDWPWFDQSECYALLGRVIGLDSRQEVRTDQ